MQGGIEALMKGQCYYMWPRCHLLTESNNLYFTRWSTVETHFRQKTNVGLNLSTVMFNGLVVVGLFPCAWILFYRFDFKYYRPRHFSIKKVVNISMQYFKDLISYCKLDELHKPFDWFLWVLVRVFFPFSGTLFTGSLMRGVVMDFVLLKCARCHYVIWMSL